MLALQDAFPEALDLRPHHMSLADVTGERGASRMEQISKRRGHVWKANSPRSSSGEITPDIVRHFVTGDEHVFTVVRNPYDFLVSCFERRGRGQPFTSFVGNYDDDPYVRDGRLYYHVDDCHTIIRYESLEGDLDALMRRLGLPTFELGRHNETPQKGPWETYYTPDAYRVVNDRFADEFSRFYEPRVE